MSNEYVAAELLETKELIEFELSKFVRSLKHELAPQAEYALLSGGKRLRPLMVLFAAQSVGGDRKKVVPLALAFELTHTSSLVHDDIIDKDIFRRGKLAVCTNWSANSAILTGDLLIASAIYLATIYGEEIIRMISQSAIELCQGEHMDLMIAPSSTEKEYFQMIESKSAALFQAAASCGATVGGASTEELGCLSSFGKYFGIAYQLKDDLLDIEPGDGQVSKDLKKGQVTLPLIHSYGLSDSLEKKAIDEALRVVTQRNKTKSDLAVKTILKRLEETGSIFYVKKKQEEYSQLTTKSLAPLKNSPHKLSLLHMASALKGDNHQK